ncbi:NAD-dependent histone deacetylase SIR2 [Spathaspora sp. JA1]|nr:NAD-dependent histone deacetylase SIR2 [Spathaspora sp. JA1]
MLNYRVHEFDDVPLSNLHNKDLTPSHIMHLNKHDGSTQTHLGATNNIYARSNPYGAAHHINAKDNLPADPSPIQTSESLMSVGVLTPPIYTDPSDTDFSSSGDPPVFKSRMASPSLFQPNKKLGLQYRTYIKQHGFMSFLNKYIPESMTKRDICRMIIDLGYPQESIQHHEILTIREALSVLVDLIMNDETINSEDLEEQDTVELENVYTIEDLRHDLAKSSKVLVITGAGISTSLGIPDFRSFQGVYSQLSTNLSEPQKVFDKYTFVKDPSLFYNNAHLVLPPEGKYSLLHAFIRLLQDKNKLLRNYTQNIDNLETAAGISKTKLIQCHGSFAEATCITCKNKFTGGKIFDHIRHQQVPRCSNCWESVKEAQMSHGVIKPDIVFFGEDLPRKFYTNLHNDIKACDLVLVIGTSLKVEPVSSIIDKVPRRVPRILINKDAIPDRDFDLSLIGYCDDIVSYLVQGLGSAWEIAHESFNIQEQFIVDPDETLPNTIKIARAFK